MSNNPEKSTRPSSADYPVDPAERSSQEARLRKAASGKAAGLDKVVSGSGTFCDAGGDEGSWSLSAEIGDLEALAPAAAAFLSRASWLLRSAGSTG